MKYTYKTSTGWIDSGDGKKLLSLLGDQGLLIKDGDEFRPVLDVFPALANTGDAFCPECMRWYDDEEITETVIRQKWGTVTQRQCPNAHYVDSAHSYTASVKRFLESQHRTTGRAQAQERDRQRDA